MKNERLILKGVNFMGVILRRELIFQMGVFLFSAYSLSMF